MNKLEGEKREKIEFTEKLLLCQNICDLAPELVQLIGRSFHAGTFSFTPSILSKNSAGVRPPNAV